MTSIRNVTLSLLVIAAAGCTADAPPAAAEANVVEVIARGLQFEAPAQVPAGWSTFRFRNESGMVHFALIERLPAGIGIAEQQAQVAPVFQQGMDLLNAGEGDAALARFGELPAWFGEIVFLGGPGLTAPGVTAETTVFLEPGTYLIECYVKTGGIFHSYNPLPGAYGMVHQFTVSAETSTAPEPVASLKLTLSGEGGIQVAGEPRRGEQVVAVHFQDQRVHENFVGHDVHLVRLEADTDLQELALWMDWSGKTGLQTPAPAVFLGGINEMPAGSTGYVKVNLAPGRYAWIAEVPGAGDKGMLRVFAIEGESDG